MEKKKEKKSHANSGHYRGNPSATVVTWLADKTVNCSCCRSITEEPAEYCDESQEQDGSARLQRIGVSGGVVAHKLSEKSSPSLATPRSIEMSLGRPNSGPARCSILSTGS